MKQTSNWKTTLGGILLSAYMICQSQGIHIGHAGNGDFTSLAGIAGALLTGAAARDSSNTDPMQPPPKQ